MTVHKRSSAPIASSLDVLRRQFGLGRAGSVETISGMWPDLVGEAAATRSVVIDLRQGVLTVDAHDPPTAEVLTWSKQRVLEASREACPGERIVDLTVRVRRPRPASGR